MFSRRDLFRFFGSLWAVSSILGATSQDDKSGLKITLAHEFAKSSARAIAPDGTKMCLESWPELGYPLRGVEIGKRRTIYSGTFRSRIPLVFFP